MPRVALITGAAQGLGHTTALRLASDGFTVAVNDLADDGRLADLAERTGGLRPGPGTGAVAFLAGPRSSAVVGQILQPNGGVTRTRA